MWGWEFAAMSLNRTDIEIWGLFTRIGTRIWKPRVLIKLNVSAPHFPTVDVTAANLLPPFPKKCSFLSLSCGVLVRIYVVGQSLAKDETRQNRQKRLIIQAALGPDWAWEYIHLNLCGDGVRACVGCTTANIISGRKHAKDNGYAPIREKEHLLSCTWDPVM